ncbi:hypothetical protein SALBM135S_00428 [Streptomyces alboniger]
MRTLAAERAVIVVAHRISTVQDADLIVVVDEGRIVDRGTHEELLTRSSLYQELVHGQSLRAPARRSAGTGPVDAGAAPSGAASSGGPRPTAPVAAPVAGAVAR